MKKTTFIDSPAATPAKCAGRHRSHSSQHVEPCKASNPGAITKLIVPSCVAVIGVLFTPSHAFAQFASPANASFGSATLVSIVVALGLVYLYSKEKQKNNDLVEQHKSAQGFLQQKLLVAETIAMASSKTVVAWESGKDPTILQHGNFGVETIGSNKLWPPDRWLTEDSHTELLAKLENLRLRGSKFDIFVEAKNGDFVEVSGRAFRHVAVLGFSKTIGNRNEVAQLRSAHQSLTHNYHDVLDVLGSLPVPVWIRNTDNSMRWSNRAYRDLYDLSDTEIAQQDPNLLDEEQRLSVESHELEHDYIYFRKQLTNQSNQQNDLDVYFASGARARGGIALNVSEIADLERQSASTFEETKLTTNHLPIAVAIFGTDKKLKHANPMLKRTFPKLANRMTSDISIESFIDGLREEEYLQHRPEFRKWRTNLVEIHGNGVIRDERWDLQDGRTIQARIVRSPARGWIAIFEDKTDAERLVQERTTLSDEQSLILNSLDIAVALISIDGNIRISNKLFAALLSPEETDDAVLENENTHCHISEFIERARPLTKSNSALDEVYHAIVGGRELRRRVNCTIDWTDGRITRCNSVPIRGNTTMITFLDITELANVEKTRKRQAEDYQSVSLLNRYMLNTVANEMQAPLLTILGYSELGGSSDDDQKQPTADFFKQVASAGYRLKSLMLNVRDGARIAGGELEVKPQVYDMNDLVELVTSNMTSLHPERDFKINITSSLKNSDPTGDVRHVVRVIESIFEVYINNLKASSTINVTTEQNADNASVSIAASTDDFEGRCSEVISSNGSYIDLAKLLSRTLGGKISITNDEDQLIVSIVLPSNIENSQNVSIREVA